MKFTIHETDGCAWMQMNSMFIFGKDVDELTALLDAAAAKSDYIVVKDALMRADDVKAA